MGTPRTKYSTVSKQADSEGTPLANGVIIRRDGRIEAEGFVDHSDNPIEYDLLSNKKSFFFKQQIDENTELAYIPAFYPTKVYKTKVKRSLELNNVFAVIEGRVEEVRMENLDRFKHAGRRLKNEIRKIHKANKNFNFTENLGGEEWNRIYTRSTTLGPYNYDTKLEVTEDIEFINDVLIVTTGGFNVANMPDEEVIVYMTPHDVVSYTGEVDYITTGEHVYDDVLPAGYSTDNVTFRSRDLGITNEIASYAVTSHGVTIPKGEFLQFGHGYKYTDNYLNFDSDNNDDELIDTVIANQYAEYEFKISVEQWDGVIPSGVWFRLKTLSTQSEFMGWAGEISVVPVEGQSPAPPSCSFNESVTSEGVDGNYETSINKGKIGAERKLYKKLNNYLINKGVKNKNSRHRKYEKLLKYSAWNVYDWNMIRNENVAKKQGTVSSPLDGAMYYDGTSATYGGSNVNSSYDYSNIVEEKLDTGAVYGPKGLLIRDPSQFENTDEYGEVQTGPEKEYTWDDETETYVEVTQQQESTGYGSNYE